MSIITTIQRSHNALYLDLTFYKIYPANTENNENDNVNVKNKRQLANSLLAIKEKDDSTVE